MDQNRILYLIEKFEKRTATEEELFELETFYNQFEKKQGYIGYLDDAQKKVYKDLIFDRVHTKVHQSGKSVIHIRNKKLLIRFIGIAASLLLCIGLGIYYNQSVNNEKTHIYVKELASNVETNENKVILTLANGERISLTDVSVGEIVNKGGIKIDKTAEGQLIYTISDKKSKETHTFNTIETPIGSQYLINLPDGSKVWLNSMSKLRYPVQFSENERRVELTGEAYFEIASVYSSSPGTNQSQKLPFIVQSGNQEVEVLGTHFNISAYKDDEEIRTVLLEGSVKVSLKNGEKMSGVYLKPGQMALNILKDSKIDVSDVDVSDVKAWKNGYFIFNNENIKDIMKKLSRWYGFEVAYQGDMSGVDFQGNYLRTRDLTNLLKTMEMTNKLKFQVIQGDNNQKRRVVVIRNN